MCSHKKRLIEAILMNTHNISFSIYKDTLNFSKSAALGFFSKGLKNEFIIAMVNEPSVFEPLKVYCILSQTLRNIYQTKQAISSNVLH